MSQTILDYYKYAALTTASYVRMGGQPLDGATFARISANPELSADGRVPLPLGQRLFDPQFAVPGEGQWQILSYYGGDIPESIDPIAAADKSGFGATLFKNTLTGEAVLAVRGTEPFAGVAVDLLSSDLGQIGIFGIALTQVVSMANYVMRLREPTSNHNVAQIKVEAT